MAGTRAQGTEAPLTHPVFDIGRSDLPEDLKPMYDSVLASLQNDAVGKLGFGFLEQMMCERLAVLYCVGLDRKRRGIGVVNPAAKDNPTGEPGFADWKEFDDFNKMWFDLATKLQRAQSMTVDANRSVEQARARYAKEYSALLLRIIEAPELDLPVAARDKMKRMAQEGFDLIHLGVGS